MRSFRWACPVFPYSIEESVQQCPALFMENTTYFKMANVRYPTILLFQANENGVAAYRIDDPYIIKKLSEIEAKLPSSHDHHIVPPCYIFIGSIDKTYPSGWTTQGGSFVISAELIVLAGIEPNCMEINNSYYQQYLKCLVWAGYLEEQRTRYPLFFCPQRYPAPHFLVPCGLPNLLPTIPLIQSPILEWHSPNALNRMIGAP